PMVHAEHEASQRNSVMDIGDAGEGVIGGGNVEERQCDSSEELNTKQGETEAAKNVGPTGSARNRFLKKRSPELTYGETRVQPSSLAFNDFRRLCLHGL